MPKTIVTGAAEFIASHLAETLLKKGEEVIGVDELNNYMKKETKPLLIYYLNSFVWGKN